MAALPLERDVPLLERAALLLRVLPGDLERAAFAPVAFEADFPAVDFAFALDPDPLAEALLR